MAFPLMALGAGLGIAADDINKQRAQQAQLQMQQMKYAAELAQLRMALQQNQQKNQTAQDLAALSLPGGAPGGGDGGGFAAQPGPNNSPYVSSGGGAGGGGQQFGTGLHRLDYPQIHSLAQQAGFQGPAADTMTAIALGESGGDPFAVGDRKIGGSYGLTQINERAHGPVAETALGNPAQALRLAYDISHGGTDFSPWSVYKSGAYKRFMQPIGPQAAPYAAMPQPGGAPAMARPDAAEPPGSIQTDAAGSYRVPATYGSQAADAAIFGTRGTGETQVAQAVAPGRQTATDAGSQTPLPKQPTWEDAVNAVVARNPEAARRSPQALALAAKAEFERLTKAFSEQMQIHTANRSDATANRQAAAQEARAKSEGTQVIETDQGPMIVNRGTGEVRPVQLPGGAKVVSGKGATEKFGDINDLMNRWHQDFVKQQGREPTTDEIATRHAELAQQSAKPGQNAQNVAERIMIGGNEVSKSLDALTVLGPGATLGIFGGAQAALGSGLVDNIKRNLANKLVSRTDQLVASFGRGIGRGLAQLIGAGSSQGLQNLSEQLMKDLPQDNDDWATVLSKFANMRDSADGALEVLKKDPRLTKDQKDEIDSIMGNIHKAVPFTRADVAKISVDPSDESIAQFAKKMGLGGGAAVDPASFKSADDVKAAYQAGKIDRDTATKALKERFGMQ